MGGPPETHPVIRITHDVTHSAKLRTASVFDMSCHDFFFFWKGTILQLALQKLQKLQERHLLRNAVLCPQDGAPVTKKAAHAQHPSTSLCLRSRCESKKIYASMARVF